MKIFLFLSFPFLFLASYIGTYQNETTVNMVLPERPVVGEVKTLEAPINDLPIEQIIEKAKTPASTIDQTKIVGKVTPDKVEVTGPRVEVSELTEVKIEAVEVNESAEAPVGMAVKPILSNDDYYTNVDGTDVHSPAYASSEPVGATAVCRDGTYSFSQHRSGTCSRHGGVARWLN